MKRNILVCVIFLLTAGLLSGAGAAEGERTRIIYMTAGDTNMLALGQNVLGPEFTAQNPNITVTTIHTGPGNAGSNLIFEKLLAEQRANKPVWDVDVAMVHEVFLSWAMPEGLLAPYAKELDTWQYVTSPFARNTMGLDIEGYAIPMFHSQTALAYNPNYVTNPPQSYDELKQWVRENPGKFGYNGIKGGASGVSFVFGWLYNETGKYEQYAVQGPFNPAEIPTWEPAFRELREFNRHVTITGGNVGTLDALNRGEIWMGPVWVDMFFTYMAEGKLSQDTRLILPEPGMPGQPMYFVVPKHAANPEAARKFVEYVTSPAVQAKAIVERFNWYPGIDGAYLEGYVPQATYDTIYRDVTPQDLQTKGLAFPLADYYAAALEAYERWVQ